jgi:hypothetical protein
MLGPYKLIVDEWSEVWDLLKPYADNSFWQWPDSFDQHAFYVVGRTVFEKNCDTILALATQYPGRIIFSNPAEGSHTILMQLARHGITELVKAGTVGLIASGDLESEFRYCKTDYFTNIVDYTENKIAQIQAVLDHKNQRPYEFLFLNGRLRPHRKYLIDGLRNQKLLNRALWSNLESNVTLGYTSSLAVDTNESIRLLPAKYEIDRAVLNLANLPKSGSVKSQLFGDTWGDAVINHRCYTDTWFSLVTETIFDYPHSFRTEKIYKPILMAHPFVVAANQGYLKDLRTAGFRTFHTLIDESYDQINCPSSRAECIINTVRDIVNTGAAEFWKASQDICKYNQQRLVEHNCEQRAQLPHSLLNYINERS